MANGVLTLAAPREIAADSIRDTLAAAVAAGETWLGSVAVYDGPVDNMALPAVVLVSGPVDQTTFRGGMLWTVEAVFVCRRTNPVSGMDLADRVTRIVRDAMSSLVNGGWVSAAKPVPASVAGVDVLIQRHTVTVTTNE